MSKKLFSFLLISVCCASQGWSSPKEEAMPLNDSGQRSCSAANEEQRICVEYTSTPHKQPNFFRRHWGKVAVAAGVVTGGTVAAATAPLWVPLLTSTAPAAVLVNATIVNATTAMAVGTSTAMTTGSTESIVGTLTSVAMTALPTAGLIASLFPTNPTPLETEATTTSTSTTTTQQQPTVDKYGVHFDIYMIGSRAWQILKTRCRVESESHTQQVFRDAYPDMKEETLKVFARKMYGDLYGNR